MADNSINWNDFYSGILPSTGGFTYSGSAGVGPFNGAVVGGDVSKSVQNTITNAANNFGGSGKSFSELSAGTGLAGIAGLLGIGAADAVGDKATGDAIAAGGTGGVLDFFGSELSRVAIIVLGFIFVAVGLSMFKDPAQILRAGLTPSPL